MATIDLAKYYPYYPRGTCVEVPDEIAETLEEGRRMEHRQDNKRSYYKVYSLDSNPAIENHAAFFALSPEELMILEEKRMADELMLDHLNEALSQLTATQVRRLHARYVLQKKFREIAADEGVSGSCAAESVNGAIKKLRKIFVKNKWVLKET